MARPTSRQVSIACSIDRSHAQPVYQQIADSIRAKISSGEWEEGSRLPATRTLAAALKVDRNTIVAAYRLLGQEGLVRSGVGAGSFVRRPPAASAARTSGMSPGGISASDAFLGGMPARATLAPDGAQERGPRENPPFAWQRLIRDPEALESDPARWLSARHLSVSPDAIRLAGVTPDSRQFPLADFEKSVRVVFASADPGILDYGPPEGDERLRRWVLSRLEEAGTRGIELDRVFIISGSQQGLDLLAKLLLAPGDTVAMEAPGYTGAFCSLSLAGARIATAPMGPAGVDVDALEELIARRPVKFLYTMPCFQNPTGISLGAAPRARLLDLARRRRLAIVEDHYDSDLYYDGTRPRPLLADDPSGQIVHLGTFSKILFPGLRIGWLIVPRELAAPLRQVRWATDLASATLTQRALEHFCREGRLERHLRRIRKVNARRLAAMLAALREFMPAGVRWTEPAGGMTLWVEMPEAIDAVALLSQTAADGVLFSPGMAFFPHGGGRNGMRLTFTRENEARIREGIAHLARRIAERLDAPSRAEGMGEGPLP
ncbi:MAG: PLP-dependent aminotransferase family protein [Candidatus Eisenbacteria bacterium]|nr:PLP-dependent aminotransferase family protein [Candidatus Eisenbacteria bacterium]